jgi:pyrroline-5-carboxylate reductase
MKIAFIGGGKMGQAMLSAILNKGLSTPQDVAVSDKNSERLKQLKADLTEVMAGLKGRIKPEQLVLSIVAGKSIKTLNRGLSHKAIVRAMPNTPAQIGSGMSVWAATAAVTEKQRASAISILGAMGEELYVEDESVIDMATAVSGSGPAYVFLFMEALIDAAVEIGLPRDAARELVLKTITGSAEYAAKSDKGLAQLREMVTSPGGTTAEALEVFQKGGFSELVRQAIDAAYQRAKQLGGNR